MATHDYVLDNASGAAFRIDLNNALAAIVSNNSNTSSPSTTYAYQWWADTSNGVLKIRNSANNDWIELLQLDGTLTLEDGSASTPALSFRDDLNTGIFSGGADEFNISTAGSERFVLSSTGLCGINTASPLGRLHVTSATNTATFLADGEVDNPQYPAYGFSGQNADNGSRGTGMYLAGDNTLAFSTTGVERFRLGAAGSLMFGCTTVESGFGGIVLRPNNSNGSATQVFDKADNSATAVAVSFENNNTVIGSISYTNTATIYNTSSDYRLKENQTAISDGITRLKTLKPYRFNFIVDATKTVDGFFAHEVTAVPEAVTGTKDGMKDILYAEGDTIPNGKSVGDVKETVPDYQGIDQSKLVPLLTAALQEAVAKIEILETKVAVLEAS